VRPQNHHHAAARINPAGTGVYRGPNAPAGTNPGTNPAASI